MDMPVWVARPVVLAIHDEQLAEHGGLPGIRDPGLLDSALARPQNVFTYGQPTISRMAAAYGHGIVADHPFNDGNKRTSFVVTELFLYLNGWVLDVSDEEIVITWLRLAAGAVSNEELAAWIDRHRSPRTRDDGDLFQGSGKG